MNDSKNSSNGLLVLRIPQVLTQEQVDQVTETVTPLADKLGLEPIVLCNGADLRIENGRDALLERVCVALEEIAAQGRAPEVSEAQVALQKVSLNHRPEHPADRSGQIGGLNSRPEPEHGDSTKPAQPFMKLPTRG